jgi:hypothetical protein
MLHLKNFFMRKNFLILLMIVSIILVQNISSSAQSHLQDVVYMNDGSIYKGVIKQESLTVVKIAIAGGSEFVLSKQNIDSIRKENHPVFDGFSFQQKKFGYFSVTEIGVPIGTSPVYTYWYATEEKLTGGFTAQTVQGYRFYTHYLAGAGLAIDLIQHPMLQPFLDLRYELLKGRATPFAYADWGHNIDLSKDQNDDYQKTEYKGGSMWAAGVGMRFNFKSTGAFLFDIGYKYSVRQEEVTYTEGTSSLLTQYDLRRMVIRMGLSF